jgi:hypothetical protein
MKEDILRLRAEGKTYNEIRQALGCSKGTISYHCGSGQRDKALVRTRDRRSKVTRLIQESKQSRPCADCGENYPYWIMQFDHLGNKEFNVSEWKLHTGNIEVIMKEIDKCEVVCANCHFNRTHLRRLKTSNSVMDISAEYNSYPDGFPQGS